MSKYAYENGRFSCGGGTMTHEQAADELNYLSRERRNRDKTLSDIAAALGVETGDVEGIGREIERLKKDQVDVRKALTLVLDQLEGAMNYKHPEDPWEENAMVMGEFFDEKADKAVGLAKKALAGGEAV